MKDFKNDRHYLLRYGIIWTVVCLGATALLLNFRGIDTSFSLNIFDLFYLLAVIPLLGPLAAIFHNSTHGSVGPKKINLLVGEFLGLFFLYGHRNFKLGHLLHHRFTDDPDLDPDYRRHDTLMGFVLHQGEQIYHSVKTYYLRTHGTDNNSHLQVKIQGRVLGLSIASRLVFWFVLLGMKPFLLFFLPVVIGNIIFFSHINFVSHAKGGSGIPVMNQKTVGMMTYLNFMTFGGYQHHNHHARPGVFHHGRVAV